MFRGKEREEKLLANDGEPLDERARLGAEAEEADARREASSAASCSPGGQRRSERDAAAPHLERGLPSLARSVGRPDTWGTHIFLPRAASGYHSGGSFLAASPEPAVSRPNALPLPSPTDVTRILHDLAGGDDEAMERLLPIIYADLHRIAQERLYRERAGHTLSATDLVHEAYLRLVDQTRAAWRDRAHFFAAASVVMRRLLVDWARARLSAKRGGGEPLVSLDADDAPDPGTPVRPDEILALDEALDRLASRNERQARVVECRYFAGLTIDETAEALGVSPTTVKDDWRLARAWLYREVRA